MAFDNIIALIFAMWIVSKLFPQYNKEKTAKNNELKLTKEINSTNLNQQISPFFRGLTTKKFPSQLKDGLLLFLCIYIPLDFLSYLIPGVLDYTVNSLNISDTQDPLNYFLYSFPLMLISTIIVHFFVAVREEFLYREFFLTIGKDELKSPLAFFYSSFLFGLAHFNYVFVSSNTDQPIFYPIWWAINGFVIGLVAATYFLKKQRIFPVIFAHWFNNVFSAVVVRLYFLGYPFWKTTFLWLYIPVLSIAFILYITRIFKVKQYFSIIRENWRNYFSTVENWKFIILDVFILLLLWLFLSVM
ncbi:MAG: lysostaphin resistance A-like protein [Promethearchaeota archaeon]